MQQVLHVGIPDGQDVVDSFGSLGARGTGLRGLGQRLACDSKVFAGSTLDSLRHLTQTRRGRVQLHEPADVAQALLGLYRLLLFSALNCQGEHVGTKLDPGRGVTRSSQSSIPAPHLSQRPPQANCLVDKDRILRG